MAPWSASPTQPLWRGEPDRRAAVSTSPFVTPPRRLPADVWRGDDGGDDDAGSDSDDADVSCSSVGPVAVLCIVCMVTVLSLWGGHPLPAALWHTLVTMPYVGAFVLAVAVAYWRVTAVGKWWRSQGRRPQAAWLVDGDGDGDGAVSLPSPSQQLQSEQSPSQLSRQQRDVHGASSRFGMPVGTGGGGGGTGSGGTGGAAVSAPRRCRLLSCLRCCCCCCGGGGAARRCTAALARLVLGVAVVTVTVSALALLSMVVSAHSPLTPASPVYAHGAAAVVGTAAFAALLWLAMCCRRAFFAAALRPAVVPPSTSESSRRAALAPRAVVVAVTACALAHIACSFSLAAFAMAAGVVTLLGALATV